MTETPMHLFIRENLNGFLAVLGFVFMMLLVLFLIRAWRAIRQAARIEGINLTRRQQFGIWRRQEGVSVSIPMAVYFLGENMRAIWVWGLLKAFNDSGNQGAWYKWFADQWEFALAAVIIASVGLLCAIREISRPGWGRYKVIGAAGLSTLFLLLSHLVVF